MRRMTIIAALFLALGVSSGAWGVDPQNYTRTVEIDFPAADTTRLTVANGAATSQINDSLFYFTKPFFYDGPYTNIYVEFFKTVKDTGSGGPLSRDSVTFFLETKWNNDTVKIWKTIGSTTKYPLAAWDSTGLATVKAIYDTSAFVSLPLAKYPSPTSLYTGAATGIGMPYRGLANTRIAVTDADSAGAIGNMFRIRTMYTAEEDSLKAHSVALANGKVDPVDKLNAVIRFRWR